MAIGSIGSTDSTTQNGGAAAPAPSQMDKEAFLKLLVAQLQHQDPLKPMEGTEFVTQLAQFTSVEQQIMQSSKLDLLSLQMGGIANNEAAALVGKTVTVRGKASQTYDGTTPVSVNYNLGENAAKVTVEVRDANGQLVKTIDAKSQQAGATSVQWDGMTDNGAKAPAGTYTFTVKAEDQKGETIDTQQEVSGVVTKVTFENGYAELILDSGVRAPLSDLISVGTTGASSSSSAAKEQSLAKVDTALLEQLTKLLSNASQ